MRDCSGKERFESYARAAEVSKRGRRSSHTNRHAYRCTGCNGFHIGSQVGRRARRPQVEEDVTA